MLLRKTPPPPAPAEQVRTLRAQVADLEGEVIVLRAQLEDGDIPAATRWLQTKVWRQRAALNRLNRRNSTLRFALQLMNRLREPVTAAEWASARAAIDDESRRGRISEQVPVS